MRPYRDVAGLAGAQVACFMLLTHVEPDFFLIHFYEATIYIAILVMLFYMEDRWAYMIAILNSAAWLVFAYVSGILSDSVRRMGELRGSPLNANLVAGAALITGLIAILMISSCVRHWVK